ncbi:MAG: rRNA maturation RNase YbeY [Lachnospiraceae bacterium]|nr:rRNA maturation RNase YbeY [Lachnospiraceae bacterium]
MTCLFDTEVDIDWRFDYLKLYEDAVDAVIEEEGCPYEITVSLLMTDDEGIRQINKEQRKIDDSTDVLSFPMLEYKSPSDFSDAEEDMQNFDPESGELILGDIVLSIDHIISQAAVYGHDVQREFAFLIVHSMLHLCGYDHIKDSDRKVMEDRQKVVMERLSDDYPMLRRG